MRQDRAAENHAAQAGFLSVRWFVARCASVYRGRCNDEEFEYVKFFGCNWRAGLKMLKVRSCIAECFPSALPEEALALFEESLKLFACGPLLRSAAFHGDCAFMRKWCATPGMLINNKSFRGGMGEMPVHIAAATRKTSHLILLREMSRRLATSSPCEPVWT